MLQLAFTFACTTLLVRGSANTGNEYVRRSCPMPASSCHRTPHSFTLRLRGAGDDANAEKELGNTAYNLRKFDEALQHYEKVGASESATEIDASVCISY